MMTLLKRRPTPADPELVSRDATAAAYRRAEVAAGQVRRQLAPAIEAAEAACAALRRRLTQAEETQHLATLALSAALAPAEGSINRLRRELRDSAPESIRATTDRIDDEVASIRARSFGGGEVERNGFGQPATHKPNAAHTEATARIQQLVLARAEVASLAEAPLTGDEIEHALARIAKAVNHE